MKKRGKLMAMILAVSMMVMMFGMVAQAGSNTASGSDGQYTYRLYADCTRTAASSKFSYGGSSTIYAYGTVRYTSKYNTGTSGAVYSTNIAEEGVGSVTAPYTPQSAYYNVSISAWGIVSSTSYETSKIAAYAGLTK